MRKVCSLHFILYCGDRLFKPVTATAQALQCNQENKIRRDMGRNPILDAGGKRSTRRKPVRSGMDRQPNSLTNNVAILGIEPGPQW